MSSSKFKKYTGMSSSNTLGALVDPIRTNATRTYDAYKAGGSDGVLNALKEGEFTDPARAFHSSPSAPIEPPPTATDGAAEGSRARDRVRRQAYRAQGRRSTIRTNSMGSYTGAPAQLLGS